MAILKTEALILKTFDFRETSMIAHFFSKDYGRIDGILKGIRKDPKKFASRLEPFSTNEIVFYQARSSGLHLISQCDLIENFNHIRAELKSIAFSSYLIDLLGHLMPHEEKNEQVYTLANAALRHMNSGADTEKVVRVFIIKFLKIIGFRPRLDSCSICDKNIAAMAFFNIKRGGLVCPLCARVDNHSAGVFKGTIASILHMEQSGWQDALRLGLTGKIKEELNYLLHNFIEFHLQIKPKSREFMELLS